MPWTVVAAFRRRIYRLRCAGKDFVYNSRPRREGMGRSGWPDAQRFLIFKDLLCARHRGQGGRRWWA
jgi:hypothetical protein